MGNAAVLKPSEDACMTPLAFSEVAKQAGLPDGALNVVTGLGEEAGAALTAHRDIDFVTFTGSPEVGTLVQKAAAERTLKVVLELGGKSPQIVFDDADLERAATFILKAITQNAGQTCSAGSRLLVQRSIYDSFMKVVAERFAQSTAGTPEQDRDCGPLINAAQKERVEGFIRRAREAGIPSARAGQGRRGRAPRRLLRRADALRRGAAQPSAGLRGGVRPGAGRHPVRRPRRMRSRWPTRPSSGCSPASGRATAAGRRAWPSR